MKVSLVVLGLPLTSIHAPQEQEISSLSQNRSAKHYHSDLAPCCSHIIWAELFVVGQKFEVDIIITLRLAEVSVFGT